jgi:ankyrin repeat protein
MAFRLRKFIFKSLQKAERILLQKIESDKAKRLAKLGWTQQLDCGLLEAAGEGNFTKINRLLKAGANIESVDDSGRTALIIAASRGDAASCSVLLGNKTDVNRKDIAGRTAFMHAAMENRVDACELLLKNGADLNAKDGSGWTALMLASWKRRLNACAFLVGNGADIYAEDPDGKTALALSGSNETEAFLKSLDAIGKRVGRDMLLFFLSGFRECIHQ